MLAGVVSHRISVSGGELRIREKKVEIVNCDAALPRSSFSLMIRASPDLWFDSPYEALLSAAQKWSRNDFL